MQRTTMLIISNATHNYAYHQQCNAQLCLSSAMKRTTMLIISKAITVHCTTMVNISNSIPTPIISNAMHTDAYHKQCIALLIINIVVKCIGIKLRMISKVVHCIGIKFRTISIVVQCIRIKWLMTKIVVQCNVIKWLMISIDPALESNCR